MIFLKPILKGNWLTRKTSIIIFGVAVVSLSLCGWDWYVHRRPNLVQLRKEILLAKTEAERSRVIERLERYYLTFPVAKEIREKVDQEFRRRLGSKVASPECKEGIGTESTPYQLESQLQCLVHEAMMDLAQDRVSEFQQQMKHAMVLARAGDGNQHSQYWPRFVEAAKGLTKSQALVCLKADVAKQMFWDPLNNPDLWRESEQYGALAFQLSQDSPDERLRLDVSQWLGYILDEYYALYDLCIAWAEERQAVAHAICYDLRSLGAAYSKAVALLHSGQSEAALKGFQRVLEMCDTFRGLPHADTYFKKATINLAMVYRQLGQYKTALALCDQMAQTGQQGRDEILVHFNKGVLLGDLSDYEGAEAEFSKAMSLARSNKDRVYEGKILEHLGNVSFLVSEYQRALDYYQMTDSLYTEVISENIELKVIVNILMAETLTKLGELSAAEQKLQIASRLIEAGTLPWRRAILLNTLGETYLKLNRNREALDCFERALMICKQNGLVRLGWQAQLQLSQALVKLGKPDQASPLTSEVLSLAAENNHVERVFESMALLAQIQADKGNRGRAIEISDDLIRRIEKLISSMKNENRLVSVHQKMYEYLKQAVTFEIDNQTPKLAFLKLDYVKTLWRNRSNAQGISRLASRFDDPADLEALRERLTGSHKLVIHYFLAKDKLYAFVMDGTGLTLLRKSIAADLLRSRIDVYKKTIEETALLLRNYQQGQVESHYRKTCQLGSQLYEDLMGWPELRSKLEQTETLYVIPDELLYEVPFATLVMSDSGRERRFLAEKMCIVNAPSAFVCGSELQRRESPRVKRTLVSADPSFPRAEDLLDTIKDRLTAVEELETPSESSDKNEILKRLSRGYQVYILFGHGMANALYPELSSMELSVKNPAHSSSRKITISVEDLQKADWSSAELVLLMGCDTAGKRLYRGSGISGLQQSFLTSGAHAVVASQWKIDAAVAVAQVKFLLDAWMKASDPARAFHEFQKASIAWLSQNSFYRNPHPYLWGSYTLAIRD